MVKELIKDLFKFGINNLSNPDLSTEERHELASEYLKSRLEANPELKAEFDKAAEEFFKSPSWKALLRFGAEVVNGE